MSGPTSGVVDVAWVPIAPLAYVHHGPFPPPNGQCEVLFTCLVPYYSVLSFRADSMSASLLDLLWMASIT